MRNNKANKTQAAELIRRAKSRGYAVSTEVMKRASDNQPWLVQVSLFKAVRLANGYDLDSVHVIVTFHRSLRTGRWSVKLTTIRSGRKHAGLWDAQYAMAEVKATAERQAERAAARKEVA